MNLQKTAEPRLLSVPEAAERAGVSVRYIWQLIADGTGPDVTRLGRRVLIRDDRLREWIDRLTDEPEKPVVPHDEQTRAALTFLAAVKRHAIDHDPDAMVRTLRGSSREVALRLAEAAAIVSHLCRLSGDPEAMLSALIDDVKAAQD